MLTDIIKLWDELAEESKATGQHLERLVRGANAGEGLEEVRDRLPDLSVGIQDDLPRFVVLETRRELLAQLLHPGAHGLRRLDGVRPGLLVNGDRAGGDAVRVGQGDDRGDGLAVLGVLLHP